ncbi:MAG: thiamine-phosphate kinase [Rhodospirillaceae bacterium]
MALDEFDRIATYFAPLSAGHAGAFGLRDDAAVMDVTAGQQLVVTTDALVENVHYLPDDPPLDIASKALRCNLSDLAAMGATPRGFTFAMALSSIRDTAENDERISFFSSGLRRDIEKWDCPLIGGDSVTSPGPEMLSVTAFGELPTGTALRRNGAQPGDRIFVSGSIGDAALGLRLRRDDVGHGLSHQAAVFLINRFHLPQPRVTLGGGLRGVASACLDISDGLLQDLRHICAASGVGANVHVAAVPVSAAAQSAVKDAMMTEIELLSGGDDYELLFTAPASAVDAVTAAGAAANTKITDIGEITVGSTVQVLDQNNTVVEITSWGYRHV